jgi:LemA protein
MKVLLIVLGILLLVGLMFGGKYISVRNELATQNEGIAAAWAQVDVALQRRSDLIPNLVSTVKGFATHEQQVIDSVTAARAALGGARSPQEKIAANTQLDGAISRLLLISENYPNLKSNENFLRLQDELAGTENRIAVARRRYNESIREYNTFIQQFPNSLWANFAGFHPKNEYYTAEPGSKVAPKVDFSK